jgi:hypothetical protein
MVARLIAEREGHASGTCRLSITARG